MLTNGFTLFPSGRRNSSRSVALGRNQIVPVFSLASPKGGRGSVRRHKVLRLKSPHPNLLPARAGRGRMGQCQDAPRTSRKIFAQLAGNVDCCSTVVRSRGALSALLLLVAIFPARAGPGPGPNHLVCRADQPPQLYRGRLPKRGPSKCFRSRGCPPARSGWSSPIVPAGKSGSPRKPSRCASPTRCS